MRCTRLPVRLLCRPDDKLWHPPYLVNNQNGRQSLGYKTIAPTATHYGGVREYDAHNLYGLTEAKVGDSCARGGAVFMEAAYKLLPLHAQTQQCHVVSMGHGSRDRLGAALPACRRRTKRWPRCWVCALLC